MTVMLVEKDIKATFAGSLDHGGDLTAARRLFPNAPEPFVDLSTGINPFSYPIPAIPGDDFVRLPDPARVQRLGGTAARWYGAPSGDCVVPAPGTQILLPMVAALAPRGRAVVLGPTFAEHMRAAALAGHVATEVSDVDRLRQANLAIVVNPNNPDGRITTRSALLDLAEDLRGRGGILVVDEAFADLCPEISVAGECARGNIVVLRSFGKFFGLAGLRLGFALTSPVLAERLKAMLGPWAVSGPAIAIAESGLSDTAWRDWMLQSLAAAAGRLDRMLVGSRLEILGGTSLFRLTRSSTAHELFMRLGRAGILVRCFGDHPTWLRWGLPQDEVTWQRLEAALFN